MMINTTAPETTIEKISNEEHLFEGLSMERSTATKKEETQDPEITVPRVNGSAKHEHNNTIMTDEAFEHHEEISGKSKNIKNTNPLLEMLIPNSAALFRILKKFIVKSSKHLPSSAEAEGSFLLQLIRGSNLSEEDPCLDVYFSLERLLVEEECSPRDALTVFTNLLRIWCRSTDVTSDSYVIPANVLSLAIDTVESLVARSCFDNVYILIENETPCMAINVMTESIIQTDLSSEQTELSTLKFLLTTGCHSTSTSEAMLRGTHLLQTIRVCYHIYLKTTSEPNKTTARAALQQLVTSVFQRMQSTPVVEEVIPETIYKPVYEYFFQKNDKFLSSNHRDAFLVLRSLCKLSMKTLPDTRAYDLHIPDGSDDYHRDLHRTIPSTKVHPALESKILALELLLYVLENTEGNGFLNAGSQFQFAIRHYLCVSLLNNCTSNLTQVVGLSLRLFVPLLIHFSSQLKTEIEAFVTNVFFVILDSNNSTMEHKTLVVTLFQQICSQEDTLAEIFLNYDCDMSAVDLFDRIVNSLAKIARIEDDYAAVFIGSVATNSRLVASQRQSNRWLRFEAMRALRQVLASLHASTVMPMIVNEEYTTEREEDSKKENFVEIYDTKKKLQTEQMEVMLRFNQKPAHGLAYAAKCGHLDLDYPADVARFLLQNKDKLDKTQIGDYLGREVDYKDGFCLQVLHFYVEQLDFTKMLFDDAIRYYLSGFRLPGEAQKIDRIMEKFAERYCLQNPDVFPTADVAFILAFSVIMLNTDLHNPAIKEDRRMTKAGFLRNNRGICDGGDLPSHILESIFDRIQSNPISLKEDDDAREKAIQEPSSGVFFSNVYEKEKDRQYAFLKERDHMVRTTESFLKRGKTSYKKFPRNKAKFIKVHTGLKDQYVKPMFDVTWGPALAVFSTALEALKEKESSEEETEIIEEYNAITVDICLSAFRLAICTAGLCGNDVARGAFVHALYNFTQLGSGQLLDHRNILCLQLLLKLGQEDGELLGNTWEFVFKALSMIARLRDVSDNISRNNRVSSIVMEDTQSMSDSEYDSDSVMSDFDIYMQEEVLDRRAIDSANARVIREAIPDNLHDVFYANSTSLSDESGKMFILQLCRVSRMEISGYGGHVGSRNNEVENSSLTSLHQPIIYSLQKLVEVTHYNMDSRPRLIFAEMWNSVAGHLTSTALHSNAAVAMYAVDSFRQLAIQFLQREELEMFEFQRRFLKPFETVMAKSQYNSTKELLLKCVEQMILMYGSPIVINKKKKNPQTKISLRSGWKPLLAVLGLAGKDKDEVIATFGFKMLNAQIINSLKQQDQMQHAPPHIQITNTLLQDHFVDLIEALVSCVGGTNEQISLMAIEHIIALSEWLANDTIPLPNLRRRVAASPANDDNIELGKCLELWWPILLGLSKNIGDSRRSIREKNFNTLLALINAHFFLTKNQEKEIQTLQLIFRGVLTSTLEHAETDASTCNDTVYPPLPDDFFYFITRPPPPSAKRSSELLDGDVLVNDEDASLGYTWLDTTFDMLMDACVSICIRSMKIHKNDSLVEEILAMLNSCLLSESGSLAVRGLMRLKKFICVDVRLKDISEDTWAVVCHMLRRCLHVRGLSSVIAAMERLTEDAPTSEALSNVVVAAGLEQQRNEDLSLISDFVIEQDLFASRRFVWSTATLVIGQLLSKVEYFDAMGIRWFLFLMTGLGHAIKEWESCARVYEFYLSRNDSQQKPTPVLNKGSQTCSPPHYLENALYGRKWMVSFILLLAQKEDVLKNVGIGEMSSAQNLLKDQTQSILKAFLEKEAILGADDNRDHFNMECRAGELGYLTTLVCELLDGYNKFDDSRLHSLVWLCPMLGELIESNNKSVRCVVHNLVSRMFEGPFKDTLKATVN